MTGEFGLTGYESAGWGRGSARSRCATAAERTGDPREIMRGPNEIYREIHLKQPGIFYDHY